MTVKRHALLLFSKPPIPGMVKTRLTIENGGIFTPEMASEFFKRSMYDVTELCMFALYNLEQENKAALEADPDAVKHEYDFFVSTCPEENVKVMKDTFESIGQWPREFHYIVDHGKSFDEHFDDAFNQIFDMGYDSILSVGGDIPTLPIEHVENGFRWLDYFDETANGSGAVLAPCQECGVSLIGFNKNTPLDHQGVYYAMNGRPALDAYREKATEKNVPIAYLTTVADVDDKQDLAHAVTLMRMIDYASKSQPDLYVPRRTLDWVNAIGLQVTTPPNDDYDPRGDIDV
ncbi:MAG: TIGR04282 family arsenosugar biosynthesis glycosyltransferase [Coriobacteriales bacterium]|jgi:glycosyltransferase A (GT-A) superfamily protein (DUF2064 family)